MTTRPSWHDVKHRSVVPYSVWSNRLTKGWDLERALLEPAAQRTNRIEAVRQIIAQHPDATPNQIARLMGKHVKPWEVRDMLDAIAAKAVAEPPKRVAAFRAAPVQPPTPTRAGTPGTAWVHPIRRQALGLPVAPKGYAIGS